MALAVKVPSACRLLPAAVRANPNRTYGVNIFHFNWLIRCYIDCIIYGTGLSSSFGRSENPHSNHGRATAAEAAVATTTTRLYNNNQLNCPWYFLLIKIIRPLPAIRCDTSGNTIRTQRDVQTGGPTTYDISHWKPIFSSHEE